MANFIPMEAQLKKLGFNLIVGIDEVGRGPLAGPVISAGVILKKNAKIPGLKDSKSLTKEKREKFFNIILKNSLDYAISAVSHTTIDKINILEAVKLANYLCIKALTTKAQIALIDGRDKQILKIPYKTIIKGDAKIKSIAAASILAKVARDKIMIKYSKEFPEYGFEKHKGYGTRQHRSNIVKYGFCDIHRKSYTFKK